MQPEQILKLEIVYVDLHLMQFEVSFSTQGCSGTSRIYSTFDAIATFVDELERFGEESPAQNNLD